MQQIYTRIPMLNCDFNKVAKQLNWNYTSVWVFSCIFAAYFQNIFSYEHVWRAASVCKYSILIVGDYSEYLRPFENYFIMILLYKHGQLSKISTSSYVCNSDGALMVFWWWDFWLSIEAVVQSFSVKKIFFRNFTKITGKQLYESLVFNKVEGLRSLFIKKETLAQMFSCKFCEMSKNTFLHRTPLVAASVSRNYPVKVLSCEAIACNLVWS